MKGLLTLLTLLTWVCLPQAQEYFLIPKTAIYVVGISLLAVSLCLQPRVTSRPLNRWVFYTIAVVILEISLRFWGPLLFAKVDTEDMTFEWFCVLPTVYILLSTLVGLQLSQTLLTRVDHQVRLTHWICLMSTLVAMYSLIQYLNLDQFIIHWAAQLVPAPTPSQRMIACLGNSSYTAMYLSMTLPFFFLFQQRWYLLAGGLCLLAIVLTHERYAILTTAGSMMVYGWLRWRTRLSHRRRWDGGTMLLGLIVLLVLWGFRSHLRLSDERFFIWKTAYYDWKAQALTGWGIGGFPIRFFVNWETLQKLFPPTIPFSKWLWAHSDAIQWIFETGLLGTIPLLLAIRSTLSTSWKKVETVMGAGYFSAFIALLLLSMMNFPWHFAPTAFLGMLIWSMNETQEGVVA